MKVRFQFALRLAGRQPNTIATYAGGGGGGHLSYDRSSGTTTYASAATTGHRGRRPAAVAAQRFDAANIAFNTIATYAGGGDGGHLC